VGSAGRGEDVGAAHRLEQPRPTGQLLRQAAAEDVPGSA